MLELKLLASWQLRGEEPQLLGALNRHIRLKLGKTFAGFVFFFPKHDMTNTLGFHLLGFWSSFFNFGILKKKKV